jgi:hypothetical protein
LLGIGGAGGKGNLGVRGPSGKAVSAALGIRGVGGTANTPSGGIRGVIGGNITSLSQGIKGLDASKLSPTTAAKSPSLAVSTAASSVVISSTSDHGDSNVSRTPVFAQILANMRKQQSLLSSVAIDGSAKPGTTLLRQTSPILLGRQRDHAALVSAISKGPSPLHATSKATPTGIAPKISSRTAAKSSQLSLTLVEQEGVESMDVDVGKPFQMMELPAQLKDHDYSLYNLEEGEKVAKGKNMRISSNIPPSRVSYAPKVSD